MVGTALVNNLKNIRDGKNRTRPELNIEEIYEYSRQNTAEELDEWCAKADFVFNLAGVNRPKAGEVHGVRCKETGEAKTQEELIREAYQQGNCGFAEELLGLLKKHNNKCPVMLSSSTQATLEGRFKGSVYGESKLAAEKLFEEYGKETGAKVAIYRFPNLMGHSRPKYNSAVSTFCWAVANDEEFTVNDRETEIELLYIDDLIEGMLDLLEGQELRCEYPEEGVRCKVLGVGREEVFDGLTPAECGDGKFCYVPTTHKVTLGRIVDLLYEFKDQPASLLMPKMPDESFEKKLFSLYLTYLPKEKFKYAMQMHCDDRGSFTELVHTEDCGQVSINISKPGITKGQHWHNSKWEQFIVVHGHGLIQERNINTNETVEFEVSGEKIEAVYMIPGWTHNIINLSDTEDLITVMTCNEVFDPEKPDTFFEKV